MKTSLSDIITDIKFNKYAYMLFIPVLLYYVVFHYIPMFGVILAFKSYSPGLGILKSPLVGLLNFQQFFTSDYAYRIIRNTLLTSLYSIVFGFPVPIFLALLINEIKSNKFKRFVQTCSYLPHFISTVVVCGMIMDFCSRDGLINTLFGLNAGNLLNLPSLFRGIYVTTDIWQQAGWGTILYLAALANVDTELYEAAKIDGAGRLRQTISVTIPGIMPTIVTLFILRMGQIMNIGFEKIMLLYNPLTYETADVISTFVYRKGLIEFNYGYSTAVGLFNSIINLILIVTVNRISAKVNETSLW